MNPEMKLSSDVNLEICGDSIRLGSTAQYFRLEPSADPDSNWKISFLKVDGTTSEFIDVTEGTGGFKVNYSANVPSKLDPMSRVAKQVLLAKQESVFIIDIEESSESYDWRFYQDGLIMSLAENPYQYKLETQVVNSGKTLIITISNVTATTGNTPVTINDSVDSDLVGFRFTAKRFNKNGGGALNEVFYSQDPRIILNRV